jgi:2-methylcitrate dehydratase
VSTKEQADHSLPFLISVALLDGQVMPQQYNPERINRRDVQELLTKVSVQPIDEFSGHFPSEMPCRLTITLRDGRVLSNEVHNYPGFMSWKMAVEKFERVTGSLAMPSLRHSIVDAVKNLELIRVRDLTKLLSNVEVTHAKQGLRASHP